MLWIEEKTDYLDLLRPVFESADAGQLRSAAQLRAIHGLRTPDALQLAAALAARCPVFITNDRRLSQIPGLRILQLRDYL